MARRATIIDVAKLCGVSPATVSRVLNGKNRFAAKAVRERILATARKLGYAPDLSARNLTGGKQTRIVGVFSSWRTHISEGINESILDGLAELLHPAGYDAFFEMGSNLDGHQPIPTWRFDGAILLQAPSTATVVELDRRRVPYVCINEKAGHAEAYVLADDSMGMRRVLDHLSQLGHKRVAYANARAFYFDHYSVSERYATLLEGARQRSMEVVDGHDIPFSSAGAFLTHAVIERRATAVITYDHQLAFLLVGAAHELNLPIPKAFSLVCFNDVFPVSVMPPPLTAVAVSGREMGHIGATLLLDSLAKPGQPKREVIRVPEELIVRGVDGAASGDMTGNGASG